MKLQSKTAQPLLAAAILAAGAHAATVYVPDNYGTIQGAIGAMGSGDTIIVRAGTYFENIDFQGKDLVLVSEDGPYLTTIDGGMLGSVVTFDNGEGSGAVLEGFTIVNGTGTLINSYQFCGGGIFIDGSSPTIRRNIVMGNQVNAFGGGIYCQYSALPTITHNIVQQNVSGDDGAGIACWWDSDALVQGNTVKENNSLASAGGVDAVQSAITLADNLIWGNLAPAGSGGGIRVVGPTPTPAVVVNNIVYGNHAANGGGISCYSSDPRITNNTIADNVGLNTGGGLDAFYDASPFVSNTILWDNTAPVGPEIYVGIDYSLLHPSVVDIGYSDVDGGLASVVAVPPSAVIWNAPTMLNANPAFADPANGDYHLTFGSPCKDVGDNNAQHIPTDDFEGDPRTAGGVTDMGADEFHTHLYFVGQAAPGATITLKVVGEPFSPVAYLALGSGVLDPPVPLSYGLLHILPPFLWTYYMGSIPATGIRARQATIPASWTTADVYPFQALTISPTLVWDLTNLMLFW